MLRIYATYEPLKVFTMLGAFVMFLGALPVGRFLFYYAIGETGGKVQSLLFGFALLILGFQVLVFGLLADLIAANRQLAEDVRCRVREDRSSSEKVRRTRA